MNTPVFFNTAFFFFLYLQLFTFVELGAGMSVQMRIPVLIPGPSSWDYKSKVLPEKAAWLLGMGLQMLVGRHASPSPPRPFSAGAAGPPSLETLSTTLSACGFHCLSHYTS